MSTSTPDVTSTGSLSTEKQTYRAYVKFDEKGEISDIKAKAEAAKQANWKKLEENGYVQLSENDFIRYNVKTEEGFHLIVPDPEQRVYIIQCGLNYIQNAKANAAMVALKEGTQEPEYNQQTIDLREGINETPSRRSLSDLEKLEKLMAGLNLTAEQKKEMLLALASSVASETEEVEA